MTCCIYKQIVWALFKADAKQEEVVENDWKLRRKNQDVMMAHKTSSTFWLQARATKLGHFFRADLYPSGGNVVSCRR